MTEKVALSLATKGALGLGALGVGLTFARGMPDTGTATRRQLDMLNQRRADLSTPMYDPTIRAEKRADFATLLEKLKGKGADVLQDAAGKVVKDVAMMPINAGISAAKKRFITDPKHEKALQTALTADPNLARAFRENPGFMQSGHETLKRFAPSIATDPNVVRGYLGHISSTRAPVDFATLKQLLEAEKLHREARNGGATRGK